MSTPGLGDPKPKHLPVTPTASFAARDATGHHTKLCIITRAFGLCEQSDFEKRFGVFSGHYKWLLANILS